MSEPRRPGPQLPRSLQRAARALGCGAALLAGLLVLGPPSAQGATAPTVTVEITAIAPQVTRPGDTLAVTATITNISATPIAQAATSLSVYRFAFGNRAALDGWEMRTDSAVGTILTTDQATDPLLPGQARSVTLSVPADSIGLLSSPDGWGPRGIAVSVATGGVRVGVARSFMIWLPATPAVSTRLSIAVPLTESPDAVAPFDASSRLSAVLTATEQHRNIAWAVDPAIVSRALTDPAPASDWLDRFRAALPNRDIYALPYADADVAALAHADRVDLYLDAAQTGQQQLESALGDATIARLAWPASTAPDLSTIDLAARSTPAVVLLGSDDLAPIEPLAYTPTGRAQITTQSATVGLVLSDAVLTDELTNPGSRTQATAVQRVLAETAMINRERPTTARHVLAALPRDWTPVPATTSAQLAALDAAPWIDTTPLATLIGTPPVALRRNALPVSGSAPGELSAADAARIGQTAADLNAFGSVPADRATALGSLPDDLLDLTSVGWRSHPDQRSKAIDTALARSKALLGAITVTKSSAVNLIASSGEIPLSLQNGLDQTAHVLVRLQPSNPRLVADSTIAVDIPAGATASVKIPVQAVANGDVAVDVQVLTPSGSLLTTGDPFVVRVRADWENRATLVIAFLLAIGVVVGVVRTVRRGRRETRLSIDEARLETEESPGVAEEMALLEHRDGEPTAGGESPPGDAEPGDAEPAGGADG